VKHAIIKSSALQLGRKTLSASPYVDPTFHIDKSIKRTRTTLEWGEERLKRQLAERERLVQENKILRSDIA